MSELAGKAVDAGRQVLLALPPAFIMLVALNAGFLGIVMWFIDAQIERRLVLLGKILDHCLQVPR